MKLSMILTFIFKVKFTNINYFAITSQQQNL